MERNEAEGTSLGQLLWSEHQVPPDNSVPTHISTSSRIWAAAGAKGDLRKDGASGLFSLPWKLIGSTHR